MEFERDIVNELEEGLRDMPQFMQMVICGTTRWSTLCPDGPQRMLWQTLLGAVDWWKTRWVLICFAACHRMGFP